MVLNKKHLQKSICTPGSTTKRTKEMASTSTKMKVYIRVRPFNNKEENAEYR